MTRDPRTDPRPGDEVRNGPFTYRVLSIDGGIVEHEMRDAYRSSVEACRLQEWAQWAHTTEIIQRGDDDAR